MIKRIDSIVSDLKKCNGKCRRCRFRDGFSGECMRVNNAIEYIKIIEEDNAKQKVYCKDCIYCQKKDADHSWQREEYRCLHKEGLSSLYVQPMNYCSSGVTKNEIT